MKKILLLTMAIIILLSSCASLYEKTKESKRFPSGTLTIVGYGNSMGEAEDNARIQAAMRFGNYQIIHGPEFDRDDTANLRWKCTIEVAER
jgi:hypothetical protein